MKSYVFKVELEQDPGSGLWSAVIPALPGCAVDAGSAEQALEAIREAANAYVEVLVGGLYTRRRVDARLSLVWTGSNTNGARSW